MYQRKRIIIFCILTVFSAIPFSLSAMKKKRSYSAPTKKLTLKKIYNLPIYIYEENAPFTTAFPADVRSIRLHKERITSKSDIQDQVSETLKNINLGTRGLWSFKLLNELGEELEEPGDHLKKDRSYTWQERIFAKEIPAEQQVKAEIRIDTEEEE
jgi:hypothetical protein